LNGDAELSNEHAEAKLVLCDWGETLPVVRGRWVCKMGSLDHVLWVDYFHVVGAWWLAFPSVVPPMSKKLQYV